MRTLTRTSESTAEPVSLAEIKGHLRIASTSTSEDTLLSMYLKGARTLAENLTGRTLVPSAFKLSLDELSDTMVLPRGCPLATAATAVTVTYYDSSNVLQTLGSSVYTADSDSEPGKLYLAPDQDWPDTYDRPGAVLINFSAGYAATALPIPIKQWIMVRTGQMFEFREPLIDGREPGQIPRDFVDGLLDPYILPEVI